MAEFKAYEQHDTTGESRRNSPGSAGSRCRENSRFPIWQHPFLRSKNGVGAMVSIWTGFQIPEKRRHSEDNRLNLR